MAIGDSVSGPVAGFLGNSKVSRHPTPSALGVQGVGFRVSVWGLLHLGSSHPVLEFRAWVLEFRV